MTVLQRFIAAGGAGGQWMLAALLRAFLAVAVALGVMELPGLIWNLVSVSARPRMIPDRLLDRVNGLYRLMTWGGDAAGGALRLTLAACRSLGRGFQAVSG